MNTKGWVYYLKNILTIFSPLSARVFLGWGRKRTGRFAFWCYKKFGGSVQLLEDGFIRSVDLGVHGSPSFSMVKDDIGIYYDATKVSKLESLLNSYDFNSDKALIEKGKEAISLIKMHHISKYNCAPDINEEMFTKNERRVLIIAQTAGDMSLKYGMSKKYTTEDMINAAIHENEGATVYIKIHPDVLNGKKRSDIDVEVIRKRCKILDIDVNPISLLKNFDKVYTKTSQMGFEALLLGKECICFGMPFYAGWGLTDDRLQCERRTRRLSVEEVFSAAYILYTDYYNPYTQKPSNIIDTIQTIARYRDIQCKIQDKAYFFGFSRWKHAFVEPFFTEIRENNFFFINPFRGKDHLKEALKKGLDKYSRIYIWGRKSFEDVEAYAKEWGVPIYRVEDGFIRSVGLGSDLTQPYSQVIDSRGIYFDPTHESDLERILQTYDFQANQGLLERAKKLKKYLLEKKVSKYNVFNDQRLEFPEDMKIVVVPGQVEDDASIRFGALGMSNLELLQQTRKNCPNDFIVFKPHPDVIVGNRVGNVETDKALLYCDQIVSEVSLDSVLEYADEVHTMTSLVGFEALIRGIKVTTYGMPFYSGWGLSTDMRECKRRKRKLNIDELVAGTLILYPRYIDPKTKQLCEIEVLLDALEVMRERYHNSKFYKMCDGLRNLLSRKIQLMVRMLVLK